MKNDIHGCKYNFPYDTSIIDQKTNQPKSVDEKMKILETRFVLCEECNIRYRPSSEPWDKFDTAKVCKQCHYAY